MTGYNKKRTPFRIRGKCVDRSRFEGGYFAPEILGKWGMRNPEQTNPSLR